MSGIPNYRYVLGGALRSDAPTYIARQVDDELYKALKGGEYCYIFNSRQMGKSSLRVRVMQRLKEEGIACGVIDVASIVGAGSTSEEWYLGIIQRLCRSLGIKLKNLETLHWWREREGLSPIQRFNEFIEDILLESIAQPIVIFIEEIDRLFELSFNDDFFVLIRSLYQERANNNIYNRLSFVLIGVATPSELVRNKQHTSFNIGGRRINLKGFQPNEIAPLEPGLISKSDEPKAVLMEILNWTGGQPFLTQCLCQQVVDSSFLISTGSEETRVTQIVQSHVINDLKNQDILVHIKTIRDRILANEELSGRLLGLYQKVLNNREIDVDNTPEQIELRLVGLVIEHQGKLKVANRIYENIFDNRWIEIQLKQLRPYANAINTWLTSGCQDESRLLRGQALIDAQIWANEKKLSENDYKFLTASQQAEKRMVELEKESVEKQLNTLEIAKKKLAEDFQEIRENRSRTSHIKPKLRSLLISFGVTLATLTLSHLGNIRPFNTFLGGFGYLDNFAQDTLHRVRGAQSWNDEIVIVKIDDSTIKQLEQFPLPRSYYTQLLNILNNADAQVVAFDILMSEPSPADAELAQAMTENNVVLATTFHNVNGEIQNIGEEIKPDLAPTQKLLDNALTIGHIYQLSDPDGFTRNYRLYLGKNFHMPSLAAATADAYSMTKELIALPPEAQIKINWPSSVDEISNVSLVDILDRKVSLKFFKDKVILVGSTATGIDQKTLTPFDNVIHVGGVYVHAAALNNALEQNWLRQLPIYILFGVWSFVLLAGLTLSMLSIKADKFYASIWATIGFTVSWLILAQLLFINNLLLPITAPIITFWLVTLVHIFRAAFQKSISQRSRTLIEQYLSKEIQALEQNMDASSKQPHTDSQENASS